MTAPGAVTTAECPPKPTTCGRCGGTGRVVTATQYGPDGGVRLVRGDCGCGGQR